MTQLIILKALCERAYLVILIIADPAIDCARLISPTFVKQQL